MSDRLSIIEVIKNIVYKIALPVYLWSIGYKTLDDYLDEVERQSE